MKARLGSQDMRIASLLFCPQEPGYPLPEYPSQHWDIPEAQWTSDYWHPGKWSVFFFLEFKSSSEDWNSPVIKLRIMYIASATSMSLKLKPGKSFFFMFYLSIYLGLCWVFVAALRASSGCGKWGLLSSCDARASHCGCFSLWNTGSSAHGLQ